MTAKPHNLGLSQASNSVGVGRSTYSNDSSGSEYSSNAGNLRQPMPQQQQHQQQQDQHHHPHQQHPHLGVGNRVRLTAKPHGFAGAVLSPKHAQELTPSLCLAITSALAQQQQQSQHSSGHHQQQLPHRRQPNNTTSSLVPYTLWITEAWRVLGWAEPSAAVFWEITTMYHTLIMANKAYAADWKEGAMSTIPPILSCGSASSIGSGTNNSNETHHIHSAKSKKFSSPASAKELPVWLIGTFLLLHCEDYAYQRNLSGQDNRRFYNTSSATINGMDKISGGAHKMDFTSLFKNSSLSPRTRLHAGWNNDNSHCAAYLLRHLRKILLIAGVSNNPESIRALMHLAAIPAPPGQMQQSSLATSAAASSTDRSGISKINRNRSNSTSSNNSTGSVTKYSANDIRRQHDDEHGNVGLNVRLTIEDIEHLDFLLQLPSGGGMDEPPLRLGEFVWSSIYQSNSPPPGATIPIIDVEREIRQHLELELAMTGLDDGDDKDDVLSTDDDDDDDASAQELARLKRHSANNADSERTRERAKQPENRYHKELSYTRLRGTTILLKPNPTEPMSSGASASGSIDQSTLGQSNNLSASGRLHDLVISDCSDAHFYLLQPFEHATIAACTGCTIVVGAVAGLLHIVDCEKTNITAAARRILISNSCDVQSYVFSPSPPLLVGDIRSCQLAPYNTYYDGMHDDLIVTGLAAPVSNTSANSASAVFQLEAQSSFLTTGRIPTSIVQEHDSQVPQLQKASNKWKLPVELSKLEVPQVPGSPASSAVSGGSSHVGVTSPGADDKAMTIGGSGNDVTLTGMLLLPPADFNILFVPLETESSRQRRLESQEIGGASSNVLNGSGGNENENPNRATPSSVNSGSQYCRLLSEVLQLSPFRLPVDYERRVLMKADRMKNIQLVAQKKLTIEQQRRFEEELNRGFRDWLVTSGNLRQVLDLVHLERRGGV